LRGVLCLQPLQLEHQIVQRVAGIGVEVALAEGVGAHRASLAERRGDGRRHAGQQLGELAHFALGVLAEAGLPGDQPDHHLHAPEQARRHRGLGLQRLLRLRAAQRRAQLVATGAEFGDLLGIVAHRLQGLQARRQPGFDLAATLGEDRGIAGLANDRLDLHQVVPVLHVAAQLQRGAEQLKALQFVAGTDELPVRITHQVEVGQQHGDEEQQADETELHAEAQPVHERDCGIQQSFHTTSPNLIGMCLRLLQPQRGSSERSSGSSYTGYR